MSEIRHILYESGVYEIFRLVVDNEVYDIAKPDGWDELNSVLDIDDEYFNINNFIIGETNKIKFLQYVENSGFDIIKSVYEDKGGDGQIGFKWIAVKNNVETDLLGNGFEINLNKYEEGFEQSMMYIETEIKKRESQSKLLNREDISVNLFADKDLDNLDIDPVPTEDIYFKEGSRRLGNFYFYSINQVPMTVNDRPYFFFKFTRGSDPQIGDNTNSESGYLDWGFGMKYYGPMLSTRSTLPNIQIEISNLKMFCHKEDSTFPQMKLYAIKKNGATVIEEFELETSTNFTYGGFNGGKIEIVNKVYENLGALKENESIELLLKPFGVSEVYYVTLDTSTSVEIISNLSTPMRKSKIVRAYDAVNQVCKIYTNGNITLRSSLLNIGGYYYNSAISTGLFLRGIYGEDRMTTSLKSMLYDGMAPLLAVGFDLQDDEFVVESVDYFFKDIQTFDFSECEFLQEDYKVLHDMDVAFNQLIFGGKKYSTGSSRDIENGNTELEATTPLISIKQKMDKKTDLIIDEYKIQSVILDSSTASRNSDDDLVFIDMVDVTNYTDEGVLMDSVHEEEGGHLVIYSYEVGFDIFPISVGMNMTITSGINEGTWTVLDIESYKITLSKSSGIVKGTVDTPISFIVPSVTKNRTNEGFLDIEGIRDKKSASNVRHNPKYHMARWFGIWGSGLNKKLNSELIKITDYKNNGDITIIEPNSLELANELPGNTTYGYDETLGRFRGYKNPYFNGKSVEVTITGVDFATFFDLYNRWRYGINGDADTSRGYITVPTTYGPLDVYPYGSKGLEHSKLYNELIVRGKVKNGSGVDVVYPVLNSVVVYDEDSVTIQWGYSESISIGDVTLQVSSNNGMSWYNLAEFNTLETSATITDSQYFNSVLGGTELRFRVLLNTPTFMNAVSNVISLEWEYNPVIYKEISKSENVDCGLSLLEFDLEGEAEVTINWSFESHPTGGFVKIYDRDTFTTIRQFDSPSGSYGTPYSTTGSDTFTISGVKRFGVQLQTAKVTDDKFLVCWDNLGTMYYVTANLGLDVSATNYATSRVLFAYAEMYDRKPEEVEPEI